MEYKDYLRAAKELNLKPISIDEFMSLAGALDMPDILKLTSQMQAEKPLGKDKWQNTQQVNTQEQYQIDQAWSFHTKKWSENGMDHLCMYQSLNQSNHN